MTGYMRFGVFIVIAGCLAGFALQADETETSTYRLGSGDSIRVSVYGESDLTIDAKLSDAGVVGYPFLGDLILTGLTVSEVEKLITEGLRGDYLVDPIVNVSVTKYRQFFIHGEVRKPGGIAFQPDLTLRKAIVLAGGFTQRASESRIYVKRDSENSTGKGRIIGLDELIEPDDTIHIDQSFF